MSIVETLKAKTAAKSLSSSDIKSELSAAEAILAETEAAHGEAALAAMTGSGAASALRDLETRLTDQRQRVATLRAAHQAAIRREEAAVAAQRASLRKSQYIALTRHVAARNAAAKAFATAIEEAAKQYRALHTHSLKARQACPIGLQFEGGPTFEQDGLRTLIAAEMFRVSAQDGNKDGLKLPEAAPNHVNYQSAPSHIPPLVDTITKASERTVAHLKKQMPQD
jgi:hypothetical protein